MGWMLVNSILISLFVGLAGRGDFLHQTRLNLAPQPVFAAEESHLEPAATAPVKKNPDSLGVELTAKAAALVDTRTGTLLFSYGDDRILPVASITKLMTALVLLDHQLDWQAPIRIENGDFSYAGLPYLKAGDVVTTADAWDAMLTGSVNSAAAALVRSTGLSREQFVALMNAKAQRLGLTHTKFTDPTGYWEDNVSTTLDVARLAWSALAEDRIRQSVIKPGIDFKTASGEGRRIPATDQLLNSYLNAGDYAIVGGKTGFTDEAGYTLVIRAKQGSGDVIAVTLGSASSEDRFQDAKSLLAWGFRTFEWAP